MDLLYGFCQDMGKSKGENKMKKFITKKNGIKIAAVGIALLLIGVIGGMQYHILRQEELIMDYPEIVAMLKSSFIWGMFITFGGVMMIMAEFDS